MSDTKVAITIRLETGEDPPKGSLRTWRAAMEPTGCPEALDPLEVVGAVEMLAWALKEATRALSTRVRSKEDRAVRIEAAVRELADALK